MKIGTLSFEIRGKSSSKKMALPSAARRALITDIVEKQSPDLLVCAGYSLADKKDLKLLSQDQRIVKGRTALIVEVHHDESVEALRAKGKSVADGTPHCTYLIEPGMRPKSLGHQVIVKGRHRKDAPRVREFIQLLRTKSTRLNDYNLLVLCCGEINVLGGGRKHAVDVQFPDVKQSLLGADIIVNPTHDQMKNTFGVLSAKRKWASKPVKGRKRIYVSTSNWNSERGQNNDHKDMHTVYVSGKKQKMHSPLLPDAKDYLYQECEVPL